MSSLKPANSLFRLSFFYQCTNSVWNYLAFRMRSRVKSEAGRTHVHALRCMCVDWCRRYIPRPIVRSMHMCQCASVSASATAANFFACRYSCHARNITRMNFASMLIARHYTERRRRRRCQTVSNASAPAIRAFQIMFAIVRNFVRLIKPLSLLKSYVKLNCYLKIS